jgi:hypothetical protein
MNLIGQFCVFRTYSAGVHTGCLLEMGATPAGMSCLVGECRRVWQWWGAFTLNEMALRGVEERSRISEAVPVNLLTQVIEVIPCSEEAVANLSRSRNGKS